MTGPDSALQHLSPAQVAAYVDRALSSEARRTVEVHLADCEECRREIAAVTSLVRRPQRRGWPYVIWPAAAAAMLLLTILPSRSNQPDGPTLRTGASEGVAPIAVVEPASGDSLPRDRIHFTWRSLAQDARYRLRLMTAEGREVWDASTADTTAALPDTVELVPGGTYFWYVDALLPDGSSATTGIRRFTLGP